LQQQPDEVDRARGEYIALACSTARNSKRTGRMKELLEKYRDTWLGPIAQISDRQTWSRGFVDGMSLARRRDSPRTAVEAALGHPVWRTLRVFDTPGTSVYTIEEVTRVICQPACANLKSLYVFQLALDIIAQSAHAPKLTELAVAPSGQPLDAVFPLLSSEFLSRLRKLHLFGCAPAQLAELKLPGVTLIVVASPRSLSTWVAELERTRSPLAELRIVSAVHPMLDRRGIELVIGKDGDRWSALEVRWTEDNEPKLRDSVIQQLQTAPENQFTRASFVGPTAARFDVARWRNRVTNALLGRNAGIVIDRS
jgi:hypothetical protein